METVKCAAALLDKARPGWENEIDTERLDVLTNNCILGQLYGTYLAGTREFSWAHTWAERKSMGAGDPNLFAFAESTSAAERPKYYAWLVEIHHRRAVSAVERVMQLVHA